MLGHFQMIGGKLFTFIFLAWILIASGFCDASLNDWHSDTQLTYAGGNVGSGAELNRRQAALTMNHDPMVINYARDLHYFLGRAYVLNDNDSEFTSLLGSPHAYRRYWGKENMCPTFTAYKTVTVMQPSGGGGRHGGSGFGGMGGFGSCGGFGSSGFSGFGQHGNLGGSALASMAASSVHVSNADFNVSTRGGAVNVGGSMTFSSLLGSTTMGFSSSHVAGGSTTTLRSTFTPPSMHQAAAMIVNMGIDPHQVAPQMNPMLMLHGFNAQGIQLLTQPRNTHSTAVRMAPLLASALKEVAVVGGSIAAKIGLDGTAKALESRDRQPGTDASGNMPDPDSDGEGDDRKVNCAKAESPVWKELQPFRGKYKTNAKGDEIYEWDHLHNEIEVYKKVGTKGEHVRVIDPQTGLKIKDAVKGRIINL
jgi:hypothetical protein